jgi:DNA-binding CsgD family transcriptional regulator
MPRTEQPWHLTGMHPPIFVRELRDAERAQLEASLRARSAFTVRRAQIVLLSASGQPPRAIAAGLCCARQTVRNAIRAFNADGMAALAAGSWRPKSAAPVLDQAKLERLCASSSANWRRSRGWRCGSSGLAELELSLLP